MGRRTARLAAAPALEHPLAPTNPRVDGAGKAQARSRTKRIRNRVGEPSGRRACGTLSMCASAPVTRSSAREPLRQEAPPPAAQPHRARAKRRFPLAPSGGAGRAGRGLLWRPCHAPANELVEGHVERERERHRVPCTRQRGMARAPMLCVACCLLRTACCMLRVTCCTRSERERVIVSATTPALPHPTLPLRCAGAVPRRAGPEGTPPIPTPPSLPTERTRGGVLARYALAGSHPAATAPHA